MRITIFQQTTFEPDDSRFVLFCHKLQEGTLVLLPEYVLTPFFTQLCDLSMQTLAKNCNAQLTFLKTLAKKYGLYFVAPLVMISDNKPYKQIIYINPESKTPRYYTQQRLIAYEHWNEASFFANPRCQRFKDPLIINLNNLKIAMLFGFEIHFDEIWYRLKKRGVDVVLLPSANTFDSCVRWRELCKMRAFLNGCALVRANRVGQCDVGGQNWEFYGDSLIAMPNGEILDHLGQSAESLSIKLTYTQIEQMAKEWGFRENFSK